MNWQDEGLVLGGRRFGEGGLILDVLTRTRGRQAGLVHGGASRRRRGQYESGTTLKLAWTGRLEGQLGRFEQAEPVRERAQHLLDRPRELAALSAVTALLRGALDEGDAGVAAVFAPSVLLLDALENAPVWPALYVRWELGLLSALGFGLDLSSCVLSGANDGLTHVSPRSGRAVRGSQAPDYVERLLPLPAFLLDPAAPAGGKDIADGLALTGHFLEQRVFASVNQPLPRARERLVARLCRAQPAGSGF